MGDGGGLERALDDVFGTGVTVQSCCEKRFEKNFAKVAKILRLSQKYSKTNSTKLQENLSTSFCVCLVS